MNITSLNHCSLEDVVSCLNESFQGYFVPMPTDVDFWKNRFRIADVVWSQSWGVFDNETLVAFVINCIARDNGHLTAYNTGTGVLPSHRGKGLVDKMYAHGKKELQDIGVTQCSLEVIVENTRAKSVYERIGFDVVNQLNCYAMDRPESVLKPILTESCAIAAAADGTHWYPWDSSLRALLRSLPDVSAYTVRDENLNDLIGHFILQPSSGRVVHLHADHNQWESLFDGIFNIVDSVKVNNVPNERIALRHFLDRNARNSINQYYMTMDVLPA